MDSELNKIKNEIYELGEVEREAERIAQFHRHGGLIYRFLMWGAKQMRQANHMDYRDNLIKRVDREIQKAIRRKDYTAWQE